MAGQQNMTNQFWHPVMGAVDLITRNVMEEKRRQREDKLRLMEQNRQDQMLASERDRADRIRKEGWDKQVKLAQYNARTGLMESLAKEDLTPESRSGVMSSLYRTIDAGPEGPAVEMPSVRQNMRMLRPEFQKMFAGSLDTTKPYPVEMVDRLEKLVNEELYRKAMAGAASTRANRSGANLKDKSLEELIALQKLYKPKYGTDGTIIDPGDPEIMDQLDAMIFEKMKLNPPPREPYQSPLTPTEPPVATDLEFPGVLNYLSQQGNPYARGPMESMLQRVRYPMPTQKSLNLAQSGAVPTPPTQPGLTTTQSTQPNKGYDQLNATLMDRTKKFADLLTQLNAE